MQKKLTHIFLTVLILGAFFSQNYNAYFNGHYHLQYTGRWIFHSHPYDKAADVSSAQPAHTHSKMQLLSYELLLASIFLFILIFILFQTFSALPHYFFYKSTFRRLIFNDIHLRRAPPLFSF